MSVAGDINGIGDLIVFDDSPPPSPVRKKRRQQKPRHLTVPADLSGVLCKAVEDLEVSLPGKTPSFLEMDGSGGKSTESILKEAPPWAAVLSGQMNDLMKQNDTNKKEVLDKVEDMSVRLTDVERRLTNQETASTDLRQQVADIKLAQQQYQNSSATTMASITRDNDDIARCRRTLRFSPVPADVVVRTFLINFLMTNCSYNADAAARTADDVEDTTQSREAGPLDIRFKSLTVRDEIMRNKPKFILQAPGNAQPRHLQPKITPVIPQCLDGLKLKLELECADYRKEKPTRFYSQVRFAGDGRGLTVWLKAVYNDAPQEMTYWHERSYMIGIAPKGTVFSDRSLNPAEEPRHGTPHQ